MPKSKNIVKPEKKPEIVKTQHNTFNLIMYALDYFSEQKKVPCIPIGDAIRKHSEHEVLQKQLKNCSDKETIENAIIMNLSYAQSVASNKNFFYLSDFNLIVEKELVPFLENNTPIQANYMNTKE